MRKPKQTAEQKELERIQLERAKELRVENARQTSKAFSDNLAFRRKLRGIFSLLSGGFKGFPRGASSGGGGGGGMGVSVGVSTGAGGGGTPASSGGGFPSGGGIPPGGSRR